VGRCKLLSVIRCLFKSDTSLKIARRGEEPKCTFLRGSSVTKMWLKPSLGTLKWDLRRQEAKETDRPGTD